MNNEVIIDWFLESRSFNAVAVGILVAVAIIYVAMGGSLACNGNNGMFFPSCNLWLSPGAVSMLLNVACIVAAGYWLKHLNRLYGFIRANATVSLSAFLMLQIATPAITGNFHDGTLMLVVVSAAAYMLFDTYQRRFSSRSIFMVFALLGFYAMFQFTALYLTAVFFIGFMQMRVMGLKGFIAMLLGLLTPYWICYGFGIILPDDFNVPGVKAAWNIEDVSWVLVATCAVSVLATLLLMMSNMMRIISYNAKRRACNGFFTVLTITTIIMMILDSANVTSYMPTFNLCFAVQVGHAFTISNSDRRYIPMLALYAACLGLCVYNIIW